MTKTVILTKKPVRPASHIAPVTAKKNDANDPVRLKPTRALAPAESLTLKVLKTTHVRQYGDYVPEGFRVEEHLGLPEHQSSSKWCM